MNVSGFLSHLTALPWYSDQIAHIEDISPRTVKAGSLEKPLNLRLQSSLESLGVEFLYSHQAEAANASRRGHNVIVATRAASGKSLCYHLPVLEALLEDRSARALYIFPTKALAQDQSRALTEFFPEGKRIRHGLFDGDTPYGERADVRITRKWLSPIQICSILASCLTIVPGTVS